MVDDKNFIIQDENGNKLNVELIMRFEINGFEYIVYSMVNDELINDVYVGKVIYDQNNNEMIISIDDVEEKERIFSIVDEMINEC